MADISQEHLTSADKLCTSADGKYTVHGEGVFDDLMEAVNKHLDAQFRLNRLPGDKYAEVYLGSMQATLSAAVQFILGEQQADKQADLLAKQIEHEDLKMALTRAQTDLIKAQIEQTKVNTDLIKAKICTEKAQACGPGPVEGTVAYAQMDLIDQQKESYQRNTEQNYLKTVLNAWAADANVSGIPTCSVGAFQDQGLEALIKQVGSLSGVDAGYGTNGCEVVELMRKERQEFEANKELHRIRVEAQKLDLGKHPITPERREQR